MAHCRREGIDTIAYRRGTLIQQKRRLVGLSSPHTLEAVGVSRGNRPRHHQHRLLHGPTKLSRVILLMPMAAMGTITVVTAQAVVLGPLMRRQQIGHDQVVF